MNIRNCREAVQSNASLSPSSECPIYAFPCRQVITFIWNILVYCTPPEFWCHFHHCTIIIYSIGKLSETCKICYLFLFPFLSPESSFLDYIHYYRLAVGRKKTNTNKTTNNKTTTKQKSTAVSQSNKSQGLETLLCGIKYNSLDKLGLTFNSGLLASFPQYFHPFVSIIHFALSFGVFYNLIPFLFTSFQFRGVSLLNDITHTDCKCRDIYIYIYLSIYA